MVNELGSVMLWCVLHALAITGKFKHSAGIPAVSRPGRCLLQNKMAPLTQSAAMAGCFRSLSYGKYVVSLILELLTVYTMESTALAA